MTYRKTDLDRQPDPAPRPEVSDRPRYEAVKLGGAYIPDGWYVYDRVTRAYRPCQTQEEAERVCLERNARSNHVE